LAIKSLWGVTVIVVAALLAAAITLVLSTNQPIKNPPANVVHLPSSAPAPKILWTYEAQQRGGFVAAPWVQGETIFASAVLTQGLRLAGGLYAINPADGKMKWSFLGNGSMRPTASAPVRVGDRVFVGEGMHANFVCNLYCLNANNGEAIWKFQTGDHIESTPSVVQDRVYFGAGNDGVYALNTANGEKVWQFNADLHIDASPFVANGKLFVGSGPSRRYKTLQVVALDISNGKPLWRAPVAIPAWGSPRVDQGRVYVGLGNGRMTEAVKPPETPAGALLCLDEATGKELWQFRARDAVFQQPTIAGNRVYIGSRDGSLYVIDAVSGKVHYEVAIGSAIIAPPTVDGDRVYVVTLNGLLKCLNVADGQPIWELDIRSHTRMEPLVVAAPRVQDGKLYIAAELEGGSGRIATLYCLQP